MEDADEPLRLRIFIDASAVEVFTGTGQALSTRVYRGAPLLPGSKSAAGGGVVLCAVGGGGKPGAAAPCGVLVERFEAHAARSAWLREEEDSPLAPPATCEALERWRRAQRAQPRRGDRE
jgi:hypothetical protein